LRDNAILQNTIDNLSKSYLVLANEKEVLRAELGHSQAEYINVVMENIASKIGELQVEIKINELGRGI
jgi:hypothetical protein